ncbi:MAG TPA: alkaline phosphatase family protein [Nitrososphaerales archaeon]|nr:alkaline phosphatase family protein [Nitrososphaerales archaeon]
MTLFLFGLDGASLDNIGRVLGKTELPNFTRILQEGMATKLKSVYPYVTAPAWTSIFSGVNPGKHGIFDMVDFSKNGVSTPNMRNSDAAFAWDYLSWAGKKLLVMGVPFIYPAPNVNGIFVTGRFVPELSCYPNEIKDRVDLSGYEYKPTSASRKRKQIGENGMAYYAEVEYSRLRSRINASLKLVDSMKWDAVILVDELPDRLFHYAFDDTSVMSGMFVILDSWLGELMKRMRPEDSLLVVSDHGFTKTSGRIFISDWLRARGYKVSTRNYEYYHPNKASQNSSRKKALRLLRFTKETLTGARSGGDVRAAVGRRLSVASTTGKPGKNTESQNRDTVILTTPERGGCCVWADFPSAEEYDGVIQENQTLVNDLQSLKESGVVKNVFNVEEIYHGKYVTRAPGKFLIEPSDGWAIDIIAEGKGQLTGPTKRDDKGTHALEGLLVLYGRKISSLNRTITIFDVLPTILGLMKLPAPRYLDGKSILTDSISSSV